MRRPCPTAGDHLDVTTAHDPRPWRVSWTGLGSAEVGDARLQADGVSRGPGWVTVLFDPSDRVEVVVASAPDAGDAPDGEVVPDGERLGKSFWDKAGHAVSLDGSSLGVAGSEAANLSAALPWFTHNAFVHYLSPRGLEQFSGGAWGTRDVCQGPVGLLTALGRQEAVRDVLLRVFRAQNARGDWPQAFEFLPPLPETGQQDSHGDVVFWPVLAAGDYLRTTGDASLLDEVVAFVGDDALGEPATVAEHLRRAVDRITESTVPGSPLPAYGHGDWNDSLQPADPHLAAHLVSTWTAVLQTQSLRTLAEGLHAVGTPGDTATLSADADELAERTHDALLDQLAADPVLPGYLLHHDDGRFEPLVHPSDERTGLRYGVLPWIHAIGADLLTPEQARHHLDLIEEHLLGPDGARLFDRPVSYVGGPMTVFQRAEASTFWGREIGLMYMHAHLRYAEALARVGDGAALLTALAKASPVGLDSLVPQARPRQTTCYYSSSDGAFTDRYDASERYAALLGRRGAARGRLADLLLGPRARAAARHRGAPRHPSARRRGRGRPGAASRGGRRQRAHRAAPARGPRPDDPLRRRPRGPRRAPGHRGRARARACDPSPTPTAGRAWPCGRRPVRHLHPRNRHRDHRGDPLT